MKVVGLVLALLMVAVGGLWTAQGLGWVGGSSMEGESFWATVGPIVAGLGVALGWVILQGGRQRR